MVFYCSGIVAGSGEAQALSQGGATQGWAPPTQLKAPSVPAPEGKMGSTKSLEQPGMEGGSCVQAETPLEAPPSLLPLDRKSKQGSS